MQSKPTEARRRPRGEQGVRVLDLYAPGLRGALRAELGSGSHALERVFASHAWQSIPKYPPRQGAEPTHGFRDYLAGCLRASCRCGRLTLTSKGEMRGLSDYEIEAVWLEYQRVCAYPRQLRGDVAQAVAAGLNLRMDKLELAPFPTSRRQVQRALALARSGRRAHARALADALALLVIPAKVAKLRQ